ncbi:MAG TPA: MBL fold metallo-hydrolase [Longimicrobiales bacterium]
MRKGFPHRRGAAGRVPTATPSFDSPRATPDALTATWIGQSSWLLQIGGLNVLTDPVFSRRASPFSWAGPSRLHPPGIALDALPPIDVVLVSHDHYDHLDVASIVGLKRRFGDELTFVAPLGFPRWFARLGIHRVVELDWWQKAMIPLPGGGTLDVTATPAQHWCKRGPRDSRRLWCSFALRTRLGAHAGDAHAGPSTFFTGDSGYCPAFREIGAKLGPFDLSLVPIGAYEPRWFMEPAHMSPDEAVQVYQDLGGKGALAGMHWGTFILTDEPVEEPPARTRAAWAARGLPVDALWIPAIGQTRRFAAGNRRS